MKTIASLAVALAVLVPAALAPAQAPPAYGPAITLEQAKKVMAGAEEEARKNNWPVVIAILDSGGNLVMLQRLDNAQWGSVQIAIDKARPAVAPRRPTKVFQDAIAQGGVNSRLLNLGYSVLEAPSAVGPQAGLSRSPGTSTRLTPLKLKSSSTTYVGGEPALVSTTVPGASRTFWLKRTPCTTRPERSTFTRCWGRNATSDTRQSEPRA